ncbi:unnamed protein product (macronuclear) [Paramecium tetraurelia]|uniref:J domain-containing protein n=1 Tax=Paramecium tetraurelia TaxID=5888 RepID=A0DJZ6_PARTE|nr:uncharacterized protein GSPATT00017707001 [Paramecium tetraurelia]CAK83363.1 unnamed protein product [Paramecium tetraurelia]|eukprot:XP_001450760.1 hypothetical protein (macronuclear) [Paramecium tetraurelia strain d4-2]
MIFNRRIWKFAFHPTPRYCFFQPPQFDVNKDYYKILNSSPTDPEQKIKQEYYKLAKQYHPDINKGNEEKFKQINEAWDVLSDKHKKQQYDSARSYSNNTNETNSRNANEHGQQYNYEEFIRKQGPNGFYQQYSYRSSSNSQQFSKEQMEEMQKQAQEFMNMFQNGQFSQFSQAFRQATKGDPKFNRVHTFMNFAEMAGKFYQDRQRQQVENEVKRQQNVQSFANKEENLKESLQNIKSGIKGLWDQFTKK